MSTSSSDYDETPARLVQLLDPLGLECLPSQIVNKCMGKTFYFNVLCIGETGIGKSTLMDCLFETSFDSRPSKHNPYGISLKTNTYDLYEANVHLKLTVVETSGYGDQINMKDNYKVIVDYVDEQFEKYLNEEKKPKSATFTSLPDTRIHACLYLLNPNGYGLKNIDISCMTALHKKVNIIPVIAKADSLGLDDRMRLKDLIMREIRELNIQIYKSPPDDEEAEELNKHIPFAVVASNEFVEVDNKRVRARVYSWGVVEIENEAHSDFVKLREMLIRANIEDLQSTTHDNFYQMFKKEDAKLTKQIRAVLYKKYFMFDKEIKDISHSRERLKKEIHEFMKMKSKYEKEGMRI